MIEDGVVGPFLRCANLLPEALLLVSADGTILAENSRARDALAGVGDLRGRRLGELAAGDPRDIAEYLRLCARSRQLVPGSVSLARARDDGGHEVVSFRADGAVFQAQDGNQAIILLRLQEKERAIGRFLALNERIDQLAREIRRRRRSEEDLRQQREWLRVTLESIGDAVIATDRKGHVVFVNPAAQKLTGWTQDQAGGQPVEEVFHIVNEETREPAENPIAKVLREGVTAGLANHTVLISRDGRELPIDDCAAPIRDSDGKILGVVMVFHDIVERRGLEQELRARAERLAEADRRKDEFLAMLAHELRNPLAPIRNALHILDRPDATPEIVQRARHTMERQVQNMIRLVDDLLDVSRITRGKVQLHKEALDLAVLVTRAADAVRPSVDQAELTLSVHLPSEPLPLHADPIRVEQVLANLLQNAVKFTDPGGRIDLVARREGREAIVHVRDTGIGIGKDLLPDLFEPFVQAPPTLDRSKGGLGLGLTLVRKLLELHGGSVSAHSEGAGRGSEFTVRLPLSEQAAAVEPVKGRTSEPPPRTRRVLVVDDNADSAETIAILLELWGHEVRTAKDGFEALAAAPEFRPDLVLLDIGLPGMDGYEVARRLRAMRLEGMIVAAMTGYGRDEDRQRALEAGCDHHLTKPINPAAVRALLSKKDG